MNTIQMIHERAVCAAKQFRRMESTLLEILMEVESHKVHLAMGYPSLFKYAVDALGLSPAQSYNFICVARKSREIPELKQSIDAGRMHVSNARRVAAVIDSTNKEVWLARAETCTQKELEREIKKVQPEALSRDQIRPLTESKSELKCTISKALEDKLKRIQDICSQQLARPCSLEDVLTRMADEFTIRHDPIQKANRAQPVARQVAPTQPVARQVVSAKRADGHRSPIPKRFVHQVALRDNGKCQFVQPDGKQCGQTRWTHLHHRVGVWRGGEHSIDNLVTYCSGHHRAWHQIDFFHNSKR